MMKVITSFIYLISLCVCLTEGDRLVVHTEYGVVKGLQNDVSLNWKGIPFAAPPVGNLRFALPHPPGRWEGVLETTEYKDGCLQGSSPIDPGPFSEDCLYLNVWSPLNSTAGSNLPVMVWIYGGSFISGSTRIFNGEVFVNQDVVIVNMNYRLGALGFLFSDVVGNGTGFLGLYDQLEALKWVKKNIAQFGGNPDNVTIFGESAGGVSTCIHLVWPESSMYFNRAIIESGFCTTSEPEEGKQVSDGFIEEVGCTKSNNLDCLRELDSQVILNASWKSEWWPVRSLSLDKQPKNLIKEKKWSDVPLLIGTNRNEASFFFCPAFNGNITEDQYHQILIQKFGDKMDKYLLQLYPISRYADPIQAIIDLWSDFVFHCPSKQVSDYIVQNGVSPVYFYSFEMVPGFDFISKGLYTCFGSAHSYEIPFLWSDFVNTIGYRFKPDEKALSNAMIKYWTNFAKGQELIYNGIKWPLYDGKKYLKLDSEISVMNSPFREPYCSFWSQ
eukprot:TRINITY_DN1068_c0_g2_i1.p1 TRINITY_DN1068_c0_g2~~TRINITY_DN1068_c0_g2_i1.p1  ORF type:complete len:499 (+),score=75.92 TRINITY_DN1068_c0_g2_i1:45-1541(+)